MVALSEVFYDTARAIGYHQFLEINGLLHKVIDLSRRTLRQEFDFQMNHIPLETYDAHYIGEKVGCIWGEALTEPDNLSSFLRGLYSMPNNISVVVDATEQGITIKITPNKEAVGDERESREEESTVSCPSPSSDGVLSSSGV